MTSAPCTSRCICRLTPRASPPFPSAGNIPPSYKGEHLQEYLSKFGFVVSVALQPPPAGTDGCSVATVTMRRRQEAEAAQAAMDGRFIFCDPTNRHKHPLKVVLEEVTRPEGSGGSGSISGTSGSAGGQVRAVLPLLRRHAHNAFCCTCAAAPVRATGLALRVVPIA